MRREFDTPQPIGATIEISVGNVRVTAAGSGTARVEVAPANPDKPADRRAVDSATVEFGDGRLVVKTPRTWRSWSPVGDDGAVEVHITLPADSSLSGSLAMGAIRGTGRLGGCRLHTGAGEIRLEEAATVELSTGAGDVTVDACHGDAVVKTGTGAVELGVVASDVVVKNSSGATHIGEVGGDLRARSATGGITAGRCSGSVSAKTAAGNVRLGGLKQGTVEADTAMGSVEIGVADRVVAWLDLATGLGTVENLLDTGGPPDPDEPQVQVRAHTGVGNITARHDTVPT